MAEGQDDKRAVLDGAHPHGYLLLGLPDAGRDPRAVDGPAVAAEDGPIPDTTGWRRRTDLVPGAVLFLHPRTVLSHGSGATGAVVLLGHPVDVPAGITDGHRIASRLAGTWDLRGEQALVREAAGLGGRWTLLAAPHPDRAGRGVGDGTARPLLVVPDTHASQPVFYATAGARFGLASTPALLARALDLEVDEDTLALHEELRARRKGAVTYQPGRRTSYLGMDPLVPNCLLRVRLDDPSTVRHERFWPWRERVETTDVDAVYSAFRDRIATHTELLATFGVPALSLTAGGDSRVTAAVSHHLLRARGGFTFTYINPGDARLKAAALADVVGANVVAAQLDLPHRVLRWRRPEPGGTFDVLHRRTYHPQTPSRGAAHAMWADLPRDLVQLQSNCGETGTTFIRRRHDAPLSPHRLAQLMLMTEADVGELAPRMYGDYLGYAQLSAERLLGYDHHDVFYWEQRIGRWGWHKFTDGDFGHRILLPFNDRVLLETMLSLPYPLRESKVLFERLQEEVPQTRLPARSAPRAPWLRQTPPTPAERTTPGMLSSLAHPVAARVPGRAGRFARRVENRLGRMAREEATAARESATTTRVERLTWARGYALAPTTSPVPSVPGCWPEVELPGGGAVLRAHPALPHALAADDGGGDLDGAGQSFVLVLGEPVDVAAGLLGAEPVAQALLAALRDGPAADLRAALTRAATLAGSWLVLLQTPTTTHVLTDPLVSLGLHLLAGGRGIVSHAGLAPDATPLGPDQLLAGGGPARPAPLRAAPLSRVVDLAAAGAAARAAGWTQDTRLQAHAQLLLRRGPAWVGLTGGAASASLLDRLTGRPVTAVTWWDRAADDDAAQEVVDASRRALAAGVPHRVCGLREDVDGSEKGPGAAARETAAQALAGSWPDRGREGGPPVPGGALAVGDALDQVMPAAAVLWLGSRPAPQRPLGAPAAPVGLGRPRVWDLVQGLRPVALPFSDRLLGLLPR